MLHARTLIGALTGISLLVLAGSAVAADGDAANGLTVFKKCTACHKVGDGAKNGVGPQLNGIVGRKTGTAESFNYSPLNKAAGEQRAGVDRRGDVRVPRRSEELPLQVSGK